MKILFHIQKNKRATRIFRGVGGFETKGKFFAWKEFQLGRVPSKLPQFMCIIDGGLQAEHPAAEEPLEFGGKTPGCKAIFVIFQLQISILAPFGSISYLVGAIWKS